MIDLGISKLALIGAVALVVIGPEKLPRVARTVGTLLGKAQRYVADVKAEVNRSMAMDELNKMKSSVESAAQEVSQSVHSSASELEQSWRDASHALNGVSTDNSPLAEPPEAYPAYHHPKKNWRIKQGTTPQWYKARHGIRSKALSGAARVARYRPKKPL